MAHCSPQQSQTRYVRQQPCQVNRVDVKQSMVTSVTATRTKFTVPPSSVGAIMGYNKWRSKGQTLIDTIKSKHKDLYKDILQRNNIQDPYKVARSLVSQYPELEAFTSLKTSNSEVISQVKEEIQCILDKYKVPEDQQTIAKDVWWRSLNCNYGNIKEDWALNKWEEDTGKTIKKTQVRVYKKILEHKYYDIYLNGFMDGVTTEGKVVEIKNRVNGLMDEVPMYEKAQVWCYLNVTDANTGYLVQANGTEMDYFVLHQSPSWFKNKFLPAVEEFISVYDMVINNNTFLDVLFTADDPQETYNDFVTALALINLKNK